LRSDWKSVANNRTIESMGRWLTPAIEGQSK